MKIKEGAIKKTIRWLGVAAPFFEIVFLPLTILSGIWFRIVRYWSLKRMPVTRNFFLKLGFFPIVDHYYDPLFDFRKARAVSYKDHLNFNETFQLDFLRSLRFWKELKEIPIQIKSNEEFYHENGSFGGGDAELYYSIIRKNKPQTIIEIGSGYSTLMALKAIEKNTSEQPYSCELICVEPYEMSYLESKPIKLIRKKVEDLPLDLFSMFKANDILFIDSSHIIRPGGDVTHVILSVLPILPSGVWIHFHDIFIPQDYPPTWLESDFRMWNEQYLLMAFLLGNSGFEIVSALNFLRLGYLDEVIMALPIVAEKPEARPGSFWIKKR